MHCSLANTLAIAVLVFISAAGAHESSHHSYTSSDLRCPQGSHPGFVHNSYTYLAPLEKFTNITGSFFDIAWYGGCTAVIKIGTDNVPGATRGGPCDGGVFNETLTACIVHPDALEYTWRGKPSTYLLPNFPPVHFGYAETLRFESICGGKATYIDLITHWCTDDQSGAYNTWYTIHMETFQALAARIAAPVLAGDCPCACSKIQTVCRPMICRGVEEFHCKKRHQRNKQGMAGAT
ncbi:hypothetical protein GGX14DRAFT_372219 [Mycena pura]|uniref:Uncharacterized protein n=1 Tax=Mycena pura TaxID=153505 RepID=A0AAD6V5I2_9AGAR|nr:hypothetical protein GGX14DRAFT_372219 [Mycena pura]